MAKILVNTYVDISNLLNVALCQCYEITLAHTEIAERSAND